MNLPAGRRLVRVNLSEQTDMMDLLGADLPASGGQVGHFSWCDGPLLSALTAGDWVLLDELNLASAPPVALHACLLSAFVTTSDNWAADILPPYPVYVDSCCTAGCSPGAVHVRRSLSFWLAYLQAGHSLFASYRDHMPLKLIFLGIYFGMACSLAAASGICGCWLQAKACWKG